MAFYEGAGRIRPAIRRRSVVFPAPFSPMRPSADPGWISRFIFVTALCGPKNRLRFDARITGTDLSMPTFPSLVSQES